MIAIVIMFSAGIGAFAAEVLVLHNNFAIALCSRNHDCSAFVCHHQHAVIMLLPLPLRMGMHGLAAPSPTMIGIPETSPSYFTYNECCCRWWWW